MEKEIRNISNEQAEVRAIKDSRVVEGYAIVFNSESRDLGGFKEVVTPEAMRGIVESSDVLALLDHKIDRGVLARSTQGAGSLTLEVDDRGVKYSFVSPNTALGNEVLEGIERRDIRTSSFQFKVGPNGQTWQKRSDGTYLRTITQFAELLDVSPTYKEAYPDTTAALRSLDDVKKEEIPAEIRDAVKPEDVKKEDDLLVIDEPPKPTYDELNAHYSELDDRLNKL